MAGPDGTVEASMPAKTKLEVTRVLLEFLQTFLRTTTLQARSPLQARTPRKRSESEQWRC